MRAVWLMTGVFVFLAAGVAGVYLSRAAAPPANTDRAARQIVAKTRRALETKAYLDVIRLARELPDEQPDAAEVRLWEGVALWKLDRWQAAEQAWQRALEINPEVPEAGWRLLMMFFYQQRFAEAEELALKLYPIEPDTRDRTQLLLELIRQDSERVGPAATVTTLEGVLVQEPDNFHVLRAVGVSYVQLGRMNDGVELIQRACRMRTEELEGWYAWLWCLLETGQTHKFGEAWDQIPAPAREHARFLRFRGMWAEAVHNGEEAERAYRATLQRDPADRKTHYQLARLLRAAGKDQEAESHETDARELDEAREALATAYLRTTQPDFEMSGADCREFSRLCKRLARTRQSTFWEQEAARRPAP